MLLSGLSGLLRPAPTRFGPAPTRARLLPPNRRTPGAGPTAGVYPGPRQKRTCGPRLDFWRRGRGWATGYGSWTSGRSWAAAPAEPLVLGLRQGDRRLPPLHPVRGHARRRSRGRQRRRARGGPRAPRTAGGASARPFPRARPEDARHAAPQGVAHRLPPGVVTASRARSPLPQHTGQHMAAYPLPALCSGADFATEATCLRILGRPCSRSQSQRSSRSRGKRTVPPSLSAGNVGSPFASR